MGDALPTAPAEAELSTTAEQMMLAPEGHQSSSVAGQVADLLDLEISNARSVAGQAADLLDLDSPLPVQSDLATPVEQVTISAMAPAMVPKMLTKKCTTREPRWTRCCQ